MPNLLSYIGLTLQSELCLWTLLGLIRTIFDATLFKVNANLKQVWQMSMPEQLSMPVQRVLRTIISGVMLVQCFTVYVYLASYIVLLYPVFLEERPNLVLPWLLLAAIRKLLCELTSLALGLGVCVLLGPARPPCIRFVIFKVASITPAFYMWMLVYSYYNHLKMAAKLQVLPAKMMPSDHDYGLELAVRRRRTKSLQGEEQLRKKIVDHLSGEGLSSSSIPQPPSKAVDANRELSAMVSSTHAVIEEREQLTIVPLTSREPIILDLGAYEDIYGSEIIVPRDTDRILEQFAVMMLRIAACIKGKGADPGNLGTSVPSNEQICDNDNFARTTTLYGADAVSLNQGSTNGKTPSYIRNYPKIFKKKLDSSQIFAKESLHNITNESLLRFTQDLENTNKGLTERNSPSQCSIYQYDYSDNQTSELPSPTKSNTKKSNSNKARELKIGSTASIKTRRIESDNNIAPGTIKLDPMIAALNRLKNREANLRPLYQNNKNEDVRKLLENVRRSDSDIILKNQKRIIEQYIKDFTYEANNLTETSDQQLSPNKSNDLSIENSDSLELTLEKMKKTTSSESPQLDDNEEEKPTSSRAKRKPHSKKHSK